MQRIKADLENDLVTIELRKQFWGEVLAFGQAATAHADKGELLDGTAAKTLLAYFQASQVDPYRAVNITYEEMATAGDLHLIKSAELRSLFAEYFVNSTDLQETHLFRHIPKYREDVRGLFPYEIQEYVWTHCHKADGNAQLLIDCELPVSESEAEAILATITSDRDIVSGLRFWTTNLLVATNVITDNRDKIHDLIELVEAEIAAYR